MKLMMNPVLLNLVKNCLAALAGIIGIVAAWFTFLDVRSSTSDTATRRRPYITVWKTIDATGVLRLPERAVAWLFATEKWLGDSLLEVALTSVSTPLLAFIALLAGSAAIVGYTSSWIWGLLLFLGDWVLGGFIWAVAAAGVSAGWEEPHYRSDPPAIRALGIVALVMFIYPAQTLVVISLRSAPTALLVAAVLCPPLLMLTMMCFMLLETASAAMSGASRMLFRSCAVLLPGSTITLFITVAAMTVGHLMDAAVAVPNTLRMLVSSVIFDGFSIMATLFLLGIALRYPHWYSVPLALLANTFIAAFLACASLWFAVADFSIQQVWNVFLFRSPDGSHLQFGPYFWTMHTAFVPIFLFTTFVALLWAGKVAVLPVAKFVKVGSEFDRPHALTAAAFGIIVAILFAASQIVGGLAETLAKPH